MKRLRRRLFMHFSIQFISIAILMMIVVATTLIVTITLMTKDQSDYHYYQAKLEEIVMDTGNSFKDLEMAEGWDSRLEEDNIWVQIIDENGSVFEAGNVPENFPDTYSMLELYEIKERKEYNGYSLTFYLDTFYEENYLFILGYQSEGNQLLHHLLADYKNNGMIDVADFPEVDAKLKQVNATLDIYDRKHELKQSFGVPKDADDKPTDVFGRDWSPDIYSTAQHTFHDPDTGAYWLLYTPNEKKQELRLETYEEALIALVITGAIVLIITIVISIWNGFRYGNPLFIFSNWLNRMGNEQYAEVLTEREKKQVYRKNGKIKWRYRLYREVFNNFYEMAEKLNASRKEREHLEKTREEWMAGISHDLRTPLTTMEGYGRLLESGEYDWSKEELINIGKTIYEKSDYMVRLIEDFNLSFQLKNDSNSISFKRVEVNAFLRNVLRKFTNDMTLQDYNFIYHSSVTETYMDMNERLFERLMDNLIYNAIKHNPAETAITISLKEEIDGIHIIVADDGIGMTEETKGNLFSRYYRGTNTEEGIDGTGLGMSIALQVAKLHQGRITVESEESVGTTVTFIIST